VYSSRCGLRLIYAKDLRGIHAGKCKEMRDARDISRIEVFSFSPLTRLSLSLFYLSITPRVLRCRLNSPSSSDCDAVVDESFAPNVRSSQIIRTKFRRRGLQRGGTTLLCYRERFSFVLLLRRSRETIRRCAEDNKIVAF